MSPSRTMVSGRSRSVVRTIGSKSPWGSPKKMSFGLSSGDDELDISTLHHEGRGTCQPRLEAQRTGPQSSGPVQERVTLRSTR